MRTDGDTCEGAGDTTIFDIFFFKDERMRQTVSAIRLCHNYEQL